MKSSSELRGRRPAFYQEAGGTLLDGKLPRSGALIGSENDDGNRFSNHRFDCEMGLVAAHLRHAEIEQNDVNIRARKPPHRILKIVHPFHLKRIAPDIADLGTGQLGGFGIVFYQEYPNGVRRRG